MKTPRGRLHWHSFKKLNENATTPGMASAKKMDRPRVAILLGFQINVAYSDAVVYYKDRRLGVSCDGEVTPGYKEI